MRLCPIYTFRSLRLLLSLITILALFVPWSSHAQQRDLPHFFHSKIKPAKPDLSQYERVRFLTIVDFPPFDYLNNDGVLSGYNIDLIRAICEDLDIVARCQIEALPFDELQKRLLDKGGEAIIAGLIPTMDNRQYLRFSHAYIAFPARFIGLDSNIMLEPLSDKLKGIKIGVVAKTSHEIMARSYFPKAEVVGFKDYDTLYSAVLTGDVMLGFGDGMRFSLWLSHPDNGGKAQFVGGPYLNKALLGGGMQIAVREQDENLAKAFDYSLSRLEQSGKLQELYLRYFPIGFY
ncbi:transporter substrate-binding domain-containing protein [Bartonella sp. HY329]|uniref:transporter substrate-binding domain-containing protein n=1 Tax=unclassified Bartonella TaxID=2645622 RepID=UPI0021C8EFD8|nr:MULTISPECIES: transporter substrate-binding domain-containing protein [unclassified Bartonella]UXM94759.1 transporter substrate-binding domain-containing protein [Bartonella sp. HY329]UXN09082.1 transporter substrate-binding domain-containing protein [Bartonella sp. HY328]